ncbi:hypothetical protein [Ferrovibrio terrae]|uniref:hypothetical protein n=1 Tax=Ferrovibrio terrae TaxID=2594003 RepID=UPI003137BD37
MSQVAEFYIPNVGNVAADQGFTGPNGTQYGAGWLLNPPEVEAAALGVLPLVREEKPDHDSNTQYLREQQVGAVISYVVEDIPSEEIEARLAGLAVAAAMQVDLAAEQARMRFITPGAGQAMVYQTKIEEAARWIAAGSPPDLSAYPFIAAEVGLTAPSAAELVALWQTMESGWRTVAAQIEAVRMTGKNAINAAAAGGDPAAITAALNAALVTLAAFAP